MYLKYNKKSLFDSVKTRNTDIFSYTSFYKNNSNDSYKDQYSECFLDFKNNHIYYIWKKNNLIYRPKGPAIIKLDVNTGFPLEIHFRQDLNVSSFEKYGSYSIKFDENLKIIDRKFKNVQNCEELKITLLEEKFKENNLAQFKRDNKIKIQNNLIKIRCNEENFEKIINILTDKIHYQMFVGNGFRFDFARRKLINPDHLGAYAGVVKELNNEIGIVMKNGNSKDFLDFLIEKFINVF